MIPNRETALSWLIEYNPNEALVKHGKSVEGIMRHYARKLGRDEEYWGAVGLLHDLDYEKWPEQHCHKTAELLSGKGVDEAFIRAIMCHGYGLCTDVKPELEMEKILYTTDEMAGLITAAAYMRPSKSVMDMELKSLKKKFKTPSFAAGVNREIIQGGCDMLGYSLDDIMQGCIDGMREVADDIGLGMAQAEA